MAIITETAFVKNLDGWIYKNEKKYADYLQRNRSKIPAMFRSAATVYRGMIVDDSFMADLVKNKSIVFDRPMSWSKDKKLAIKFATDPKYKVTSSSKISILLARKLASSAVILDMQSLALFLGESALTSMGLDELSYDSMLQESEVLVTKGVKVLLKDVTIL